MTKIRKDAEGLYAIVGGYIARPYDWREWMSFGGGNDKKVPIPTIFKEGQIVIGRHSGGSNMISMKDGNYKEVWSAMELSDEVKKSLGRLKVWKDSNKKNPDDIIMKVKAEMDAQDKARADAKDSIKYPLNEFTDYDIVDVITMLRRHRNKKITDSLIEQIQWELKS